MMHTFADIKIKQAQIEEWRTEADQIRLLEQARRLNREPYVENNFLTLASRTLNSLGGRLVRASRWIDRRNYPESAELSFDDACS